jgi:hypothetical protein
MKPYFYGRQKDTQQPVYSGGQKTKLYLPEATGGLSANSQPLARQNELNRARKQKASEIVRL